MGKKISFLFDALRSPYDAAQIIQTANALDAKIYLSGASIDIDNRKIISKVRSWKMIGFPDIQRYDTFNDAVRDLHDQGKNLVGTSPNYGQDFYELDLTDRERIIVFGTETSGLSRVKANQLDAIVRLPMVESCSFLTLPTVVPAMAWEFYRQLRNNENQTTKR